MSLQPVVDSTPKTQEGPNHHHTQSQSGLLSQRRDSVPGTRPFIDARGEDENRAEKVTIFYRVSGGESGRFYRVPRGQSDLCHGVPPISTSVPSLVSG